MAFRPKYTDRLPGRAALSYGIVSSRDDLEAAYRLAHNAYVRCGHIAAQASGLKVSVHSVLPDTTTFVAKMGEEVVSTVSLVPDSPLGLAIDAMYPEELAALRRPGCRLGEISTLADRRSQIRRSLTALLGLSRLLLRYARDRAGLTDLCVAVSPLHEALYRKYLRFRSLGGLKAYSAVNGHPAVALRLNFERVERECRADARLWRVFSSQNLHAPSLEKTYQMTAEDARYFLVERTRALAEAPPEARAHLQSIYPSLAVEEAHA